MGFLSLGVGLRVGKYVAWLRGGMPWFRGGVPWLGVGKYVAWLRGGIPWFRGGFRSGQVRCVAEG